MPYTSPIPSLPLLSNSELMVTVSLSLVLSNQERERGFSTSRNMFYCTWDFLSSSLCLLHNFQLPFFSLANSRFYFFLHWVTCPWKLKQLLFKVKVSTFWPIDAWSLNDILAGCMKSLVSSAVCCFQMSSSSPRYLATSLPPVILLVWQYQHA